MEPVQVMALFLSLMVHTVQAGGVHGGQTHRPCCNAPAAAERSCCHLLLTAGFPTPRQQHVTEILSDAEAPETFKLTPVPFLLGLNPLGLFTAVCHSGILSMLM
ncbi:hypothetical protein EYF80_012320 [Liparis tanakae]|uniref:Uncharacterized protein n=1 Tax=Liparis tanakae TaxID=230148 RepID=A0A4Z2IHV0_9TELE|nr:hypothetical protein EYF80_012320 [Liparis tanakae]